MADEKFEVFLALNLINVNYHQANTVAMTMSRIIQSVFTRCVFFSSNGSQSSLSVESDTDQPRKMKKTFKTRSIPCNGTVVTPDIAHLTLGLSKLASGNSSDSDSPPTPRLALEVGNDIESLKRDLSEGHDLESDENSSESGFSEQENKDKCSQTSSSSSSRTITPTTSLRKVNTDVMNGDVISSRDEVLKTVTAQL